VWVPEYRFCGVGDLEPYCGYLATIPFGEYSIDWQIQLHDASYGDITQFISKGFTVQFPEDDTPWREPSIYEKLREDVNICLNDTTR
jgi:hypothetical protein